MNKLLTGPEAVNVVRTVAGDLLDAEVRNALVIDDGRELRVSVNFYGVVTSRDEGFHLVEVEGLLASVAQGLREEADRIDAKLAERAKNG